jgi:hypothetical protein
MSACSSWPYAFNGLSSKMVILRKPNSDKSVHQLFWT